MSAIEYLIDTNFKGGFDDPRQTRIQSHSPSP